MHNDVSSLCKRRYATLSVARYIPFGDLICADALDMFCPKGKTSEDRGRIATLVADRQHILRLARLSQGDASRSFGFTEMLAEQSVAFAIVSKLPWTNCLDYRMRAARAYIEFADRQTYRVRGANISTTNRTAAHCAHFRDGKTVPYVHSALPRSVLRFAVRGGA